MKTNYNLKNGDKEVYAILDKVKNISKKQGRAFVEAYVDYTHTVEAIHGILEHDGKHAGH